MPDFTTDFPLSLQKGIAKGFKQYNDKKETFYDKIFRVYDTTEYVENNISDEGMNDFAPLAERQALKGLNQFEGYQSSLVSEEFGGSLNISMQMRLKAMDKTTEQFSELCIKPKLQKAKLRGINFIEKRCHNVLLNAFAGDANTFLAPDTQALISANHTWKSSTEQWSNDLGGLELTSAAWKKVEQMGANQSGRGGVGDPKPVHFDTIICHKASDIYTQAMRLFGKKGEGVYSDDIDGVNIYNGQDVRIIATPFLQAKPNRWFAVASGEDNPLVCKFVQRLTMHPMGTDLSNLDFIFPTTMSFEAGVMNYPFGLIGSDA